MASMSEYGTFFHSSKIDDYLTIFNHNFEKISDMVFESAEIDAPGCDVIYLSRNFTKMEDSMFKLTRLNSKKNQFFIVGSDDKDFEFDYQGESFNSANLKQTTVKATTANFLYAYAYNLYYIGRSQESLDIVAKGIRDKFLVDSHLKSFTYDERAAHSKHLNDAIFKSKERFKEGECDKDYIPQDDAPCVMDVLGILQQEDTYYVPFSKNVDRYKRISRKSNDSFDVFTKTDDEVLVPFNNFVYNKEHLNLSILVTIPGKVKLNPKAAESVKLPLEIDSKIFRAYTLIKDGTLNMKSIEVLIPSELKEKFEQVIPEVFEEIGEHTMEGVPYAYKRGILSLDKIPIINRMYIDRSSKIADIFKNVKRINELEARQKVLKYYIDKVKEESPVGKKEAEFKNYNNDQIKVLMEHGLDKNFTYSGVKSTKAPIDECDSYETRTMEFYISGCTTLPKIEDVIKAVEAGKTLKYSQQIIEDQRQQIIKQVGGVDKATVKLRTQLNMLFDHCKRELIARRAYLNSLKMAKVITGDWFTELVPNDKGEYEYIEDGITMKAKVAREKVYF